MSIQSYGYSVGAGVAIAYVIFMVISMLASYAAVACQLIGSWFTFKKMGKPGWKGLIPYYSDYILFRELWEVKYFWATIILTGVFILTYIIGMLLTMFGVIGATASAYNSYAAGTGVMIPLVIIGILFLIAALGAVIAAIVIQFKLYNRLAHAFGKSTGFAVGLVFLTPIFIMILGFDKSMYYGRTY